MEQINQLLNNWVTEVVGDKVSVTNEFLPENDKPQVTVLLHDLVPAPPSHRNSVAPLQLGLRYLISTTGANSVTEGHVLLEKLVFAAMEKAEFELELLPPDPQLWLSLGVTMRPGFWIRINHSRPRDSKAVPPVTKPLELSMSPTAMLHGCVISPDKVPVTGATVGVPTDNIAVKTDLSGRFRFAALPPQPKQKTLVIHYKQHRIQSVVSISDSPVEIVFNLERS